jgi:hypothetical protein
MIKLWHLEGCPVKCRTTDNTWIDGTITAFAIDTLLVTLYDGSEVILDMAPDSPDWHLIGPPF